MGIKLLVMSVSSGTAYVFDCPGCECPHVVYPSWQFNGDLERPTFTPSLLVNGTDGYLNPAMPRCHSFIRDGTIQFLGDSTHALAGQTVDLPDIGATP